jgi:hypothetical protein
MVGGGAAMVGPGPGGGAVTVGPGCDCDEATVCAGPDGSARVPQFWQKRCPGASGAWHCLHVCGGSCDKAQSPIGDLRMTMDK